MDGNRYNYFNNDENAGDNHFRNISKGHIKFTRNNRKKRMKYAFNFITFITIAAFSGGLSGSYIVNKKYSEIVEPNSKYFAYKHSNNIISNVVETVNPTVVGISKKSKGVPQNLETNGSGVIFRSDGYIVTNSNIISGVGKIEVKLSTGNTYTAKIIGMDTITDLAVIKIEENNLIAAKFGDSSKVKVGDLAIAIGNPLGEEFVSSVTAGIISNLNKKIYKVDDETGNATIQNALQTDAAINVYNSGGALCNEYGEIIGINSMRIYDEFESSEMGFAISSNETKDIITSLMENGYVSRTTMGIYGGTAISEDNNGVEGVYVQQVVRKSGAEAAGIRPTDIIVGFNNAQIKDMESLAEALNSHKPGEKVSCKIWRNGEIIDLNLILSDFGEN